MAAGSQDGADVRFDWGPVGAARTSRAADVLVVVDVLSFTTAVTVAVGRGMEVHPAPPRAAEAGRLARAVGAELAVARGAGPWSLSPAALTAAPVTPRLVLPSPNGSAIAAGAGGRRVVAACLRNAASVAAWLGEQGEPVTVIAAGERWPDGSLRPAVEDLLGAGLVLAHLARDGRSSSAEADAARAAADGTASIPVAVRRGASGVELIGSGFGADVELAVQLDASDTVPVLDHGAFVAAGG